ENASVIMDGVHLAPPYSDLSEFEKSAIVVPLCLAVTDRTIFEERFTTRAQQAPKRSMHKYLENLDKILHIQDNIVESCESADIPVIEFTSVDDVTATATLAVVDRLEGESDIARRLPSNDKAKSKKK
ncbi:MAG: hypothetical protein VX733_07435, partial [Candidatus Latescibacterota bacterium]|nr:hypothetical protein [Candidatus Latescibacterota bacterium]